MAVEPPQPIGTEQMSPLRVPRHASANAARQALLFLCVAFSLLASCSAPDTRDSSTNPDGSSGPDGTDGAPREDGGLGWIGPPDGAAPTFAPTFYAVYFEVLRPTCSSEFCHLNPVFFGLATPEMAYRTLVGVRTTSVRCGSTGLDYVAPGSPDTSLLYLKVTGAPCGRQMPVGFGIRFPMDPLQVSQIREWILRGALLDEPPADASADGRADASVDAPSVPDASADAPDG